VQIYRRCRTGGAGRARHSGVNRAGSAGPEADTSCRSAGRSLHPHPASPRPSTCGGASGSPAYRRPASGVREPRGPRLDDRGRAVVDRGLRQDVVAGDLVFQVSARRRLSQVTDPDPLPTRTRQAGHHPHINQRAGSPQKLSRRGDAVPGWGCQQLAPVNQPPRAKPTHQPGGAAPRSVPRSGSRWHPSLS